MIKKEKFFEILDYIQENRKFEEDLWKVINNTSKVTDFLDGAMFSDLRMEDYVLQLLEDIYEDVDGWISYWIYDLEFGTRWAPGSIINEKGESIKLQTKEDLYKLLITKQFDDFIGYAD